jgi:hypothetical protein
MDNQPYKLVISGIPKQAKELVRLVEKQQVCFDILLITDSFQRAFSYILASKKKVLFLNHTEDVSSSHTDSELSFILFTENHNSDENNLIAIWQKVSYPLNHSAFQLALKQCILSFNDYERSTIETETPHMHLFEKKIPVPIGNGIGFINSEELVFLEADSNYTILHTEKEKLTVCRTLSEFEARLEKLGFIRVHHKYLVNMTKVFRYEKSKNGGLLILDGGISVPVSSRKQKSFLGQFSG